MTDTLKIPVPLLHAIQERRVVLFLGSGASRGAGHPEGKEMPTGDGLRDLLSDRFLGGQLKDKTLKLVADLSVSETDLLSVQSFIREVLLPFKPAPFHQLIPEIPWYGIATTNFDTIVEKSYELNTSRCQQAVSFVSDDQQIEAELKRHANSVPILKLHGCIDQLSMPLVLSSEQYAGYRRNRERLFSRLVDWGYEFTLLFCGYSVNDPHIQAILFNLFDRGIKRPRYYVVDRAYTEFEERYWLSHSITPVRAAFAEFLESLRRALPRNLGPLARFIGQGRSSISSHYSVATTSESAELLSFLNDDVVHVRPGLPNSGKAPAEFYRGNDGGWSPIEARLDVPRALNDTVLADAVLAEDSEHKSVADLFVIKGAAGNGKSVSLKRIAWDAAVEFGKPVLFLVEAGAVRPSALQELSDLVRRRIFLFVDSAARHAGEIEVALDFCERRHIQLTVITSERDNEWNVRCEALDSRVVREYPLRYLSEREIHRLLELLAEHRALGLLEELTPQQRVEAFLVRAQRQLLVALHEATLGRPFEEIVVDEFSRVIPERAKLLYLDVCTLNRLGVGVRAGLISRVSGIALSDFRKDFLDPLQYVVRSYEDKYSGDFMYCARHPHVAEIVFENVLSDPESRFEQVARMMSEMNLSYGTDLTAFRQLTRPDAVVETFPSYDLGRRLYDIAIGKVGEDSGLLLQRGIFERRHGNLSSAERLLTRAHELAPHNKNIQNGLAVLQRHQANEAENPLERAEYRRRARRQLRSLTGGGTAKPQDYSALAEIELDGLRDLVLNENAAAKEQASDRELTAAAQAVEEAISEGFVRYPGHEYLHDVEARYRILLREHTEAAKALRTSLDTNPRNEWAAVRLADFEEEQGRIEEAKKVLFRCIESRPTAKRAHLALAKLYLRHGIAAEKALIRDHLRKSFSDGDANLEAQFLYARQLFVERNFGEAERRFQQIDSRSLPPSLRNRVRERVRDVDGSAKKFRGRVSKREEAYCFITCEELKDEIYCHVSSARDGEWGRVRLNGPVLIEVGFNFRGACAASLTCIE